MSAPGPPERPEPRPRRIGPEGEVAVYAADEQSVEPVDVQRYSDLAAAVLAAEGVRGEAELALLFVDEDTIAGLNERFLGGSGPTDVLAFPLDAADDLDGAGGGGPSLAGPDRPAGSPSDVPLLLGDVVVCPAVAARNAPGHAGRYEDELALLVVHGVLHVLGHDHEDDEEAAAMQARERELLGAHYGPLAADPWQER